MTRSHLSQSFSRSEKLACATWQRRLLHNPFKYVYAFFYRHIWLPVVKQPSQKTINTFFGRKMQVVFPSGTDIYLTGAKTDDAEIRLTKFLLRNVSPSTYFIDIGAHFGYYSLLADTLGAKKVWAIEPSPNNFNILQKNTAAYKDIMTVNTAFSDKEGNVELSEFPHLYSEYTTVFPNQFAKEKWFRHVPLTKTIVKATTIDSFFNNEIEGPVIIKIDAEGSEYDILSGARHFLDKHTAVTIIMEYAGESSSGHAHDNAVSLLSELGFSCCFINHYGELSICDDLKKHMINFNLRTDNLAFIRNYL